MPEGCGPAKLHGWEEVDSYAIPRSNMPVVIYKCRYCKRYLVTYGPLSTKFVNKSVALKVVDKLISAGINK